MREGAFLEVFSKPPLNEAVRLELHWFGIWLGNKFISQNY